jgi:hypothetical protein
MMKIKTNKKIAGAAAMLLLSTTMLGTSTFAWFTMNKEVTVTGMQVHTTVGSNLLISKTNVEGTYTKDLIDSVEAHLEPVSTVDGVNYFYTVEADDAGRKFETGSGTMAPTYTYVAYNSADTSTFTTDYGVADNHTAVGYVDYNFYLKATTSDDATKLSMNKVNLLYNGAAVTEKAWRVAMFVKETTLGTTETATAAAANRVTILPISGATNFTSGKAVSATNALGDVTYGTKAIVDNAVAANSTKYYSVVVRLWIEGEDTTCNTKTYANLTDNYTLDLQFFLDNNQDGTQVIDSDTTFTVPQ